MCMWPYNNSILVFHSVIYCRTPSPRPYDGPGHLEMVQVDMDRGIVFPYGDIGWGRDNRTSKVG